MEQVTIHAFSSVAWGTHVNVSSTVVYPKIPNIIKFFFKVEQTCKISLISSLHEIQRVYLWVGCDSSVLRVNGADGRWLSAA